MGRKIVCPDCGSIVDEDILKAKNSENTCLICGANLGGDSITMDSRVVMGNQQH